MNDEVTFSCPRRAEYGWAPGERGGDTWQMVRADFPTCSYCGSLEPELFMDWLRKGSIQLGPTDKNYKVYVEVEQRKQTKFYFQHLSVAQCAEFVDLYNRGIMWIDDPHYFYVMPFFMKENER